VSSTRALRIAGPLTQTAVFTACNILVSLLAMVTTALLARHLGATQFGTYAFAVALVFFLTMFFEFGVSLPAARLAAAATGERERRVVLGASILVYLPIGAGFALTIFALSFVSDSIFNAQAGDALRVMAPFTFAYPFFPIAQQLAQGVDRLHTSAITGVVGQAAFFVLIVSAFLVGSTLSISAALVLRALAFTLGATIFVAWIRPLFRGARAQVRPLLAQVREYGFSVYIGRVLSGATYSMDTLMLAAFADARSVGLYTIAGAIAYAGGLPVTGLATALFARMTREDRLDRRWVLAAWAGGAVAFALTVVLARPFLHIAFSSAYGAAFTLVIALALAQMLRGVTSVYNSFLSAHARGRELRNAAVVLTGSNVVFNFALIPAYGAPGAAWASFLALALNLVAHVVYYRRSVAPATTRSLLTRVGPHPVLLSRFVVHRLAQRTRAWRLRRSYDRLVARVPQQGRLRVAPLDIGPAAELPGELQADAERLYTEAETILEGTVAYLGSGPVAIGPDIDWHRDFKSGYRWPADTFYQDLEVTRLSDASDAKVPWELSRGHQLLTLARAATLFRDERFARELERQLASWLDANPPGRGINWVNPMEVAIRAVNWIWAIRTLEAWRPLDPALRRRVTASMQSHGRHIAANLEGSPLLRSNHYLSDVLGLMALGAVIAGDPAAARWRRLARRELDRQMLAQVHDDGVGFEASTSYHGLALEIFLLGRILSIQAWHLLSPKYDARLQRMLDVSRAIRHPDGRVPLFGDGDSGRVLPGGFDRPPTHDPLLWLGSMLLGTGRPVEGPVDPEVAWTLGVCAWRAATELAPEPEPPSAFPDGGLYVLRGGGCHAVVRCGDVGQNGAGGHAHNDVLSFELSYGIPFVVDSGTYAYTADPDARNAFRSSRAHNVVVVDDRELNPLPSRDMFRLPQVAHARVEHWQESAHTTRLVLSHDGYADGPGGVLHRRTLELDRRTGRLSLVDELVGTGEHVVESLLHLAPGTAVTATGPGAFELARGDDCAHVAFWGVGEIEVTEGWVSSEFGSRERAPLLVARAPARLPARFGYAFAPATPIAASTIEHEEVAAA
jgi:O-antigen/teichoic acid export membrane protein